MDVRAEVSGRLNLRVCTYQRGSPSDPRATPRAPAHTHAKVTAYQEWVPSMSMVVFTLKCVCTTMIADGFQPQTCAGAWCVMHWHTRCG